MTSDGTPSGCSLLTRDRWSNIAARSRPANDHPRRVMPRDPPACTPANWDTRLPRRGVPLEILGASGQRGRSFDGR